MPQSHRSNANFSSGGAFSGLQESPSLGHLLQEVTPNVHSSEPNYEKTDQLQK